MFTLSAINFATLELLTEKEIEDFASASKKCHDFWEAVGKQIPEWSLVRESKITSGDVRRDFIHSHAIVLQALGRAGRALYQLPKSEQAKRIKKLAGLDWSRKNAVTWEGRAMIGGSMAKSGQNITLTCNAIKQVMGLGLTAEEASAEAAHMAAKHPSVQKRIKK